MAHTAEIRIGTSGWHYKHWIGRFYPSHSSGPAMLNYYVQHFDTVELNNSFYKLPDISVFRSWREAVPDQFCFSVKASRFITHNKKLKDPQNALDNFLPRAEVLGAKLGPVLFQLPPRWKLNLERLQQFLAALPRYHQYTFEFREPSWNTSEVFDLLRTYNAAYCIYQLGWFKSPIELTADWAYIRLHGPGGKYQGSYTGAQLTAWANRIVHWSSRLKSIYVYFDNDDSAYAAFNALALKRLIQQRLPAEHLPKAA
jgi:uncharacterized protein YecE (DUF72 family)